jgi:hypothetical protein
VIEGGVTTACAKATQENVTQNAKKMFNFIT